jgi:hypothetical protein
VAFPKLVQPRSADGKIIIGDKSEMLKPYKGDSVNLVTKHNTLGLL